MHVKVLKQHKLVDVDVVDVDVVSLSCTLVVLQNPVQGRLWSSPDADLARIIQESQ